MTDLCREVLQLRDMSYVSQEGRRRHLVEAAARISPAGRQHGHLRDPTMIGLFIL